MELFASTIWLLTIKTITFFGKGYLFARVIAIMAQQPAATENQALRSSSKQLWSILGLLLFCTMFDDVSWILKVVRRTWFMAEIPATYILCLVRLTWVTSSIQYFSLTLLIEKLINKRFRWKAQHYFGAFCCAIVIAYLLLISYLHFDIVNNGDRTTELMAYNIIIAYQFISLIPTFILAVGAWSQKKLPKILQQQSKTLLLYLIIPYVLLFILSYQPVMLLILTNTISNEYFLIGLNSLFFTGALYFCSWKMLGLRFLQVNSHVEELTPYNFINDFKNFLERLGHINNVNELQHITSAFFQHAFDIPNSTIKLYIRNIDTEAHEAETVNRSVPMVEQLITNHTSNSSLLENIEKRGILVRDEIDFDNFYEATETHQQLINLLETTDASIFLPLYEGHSIAGYIVVQAHARPDKLFTNTEQNEMLVFAQYISNVIYLLRHRNLEALILKEKELKEELHFKHQEIHHYKESIRTLLKTHTTQKIGVIYHRNRILTYGNQAAKELLKENSAHVTNQLYAAPLKRLVSDVKKYGFDRKITLHDPYNNPLICSASIGANQGQITILIYYTSITDKFTIPFDTLKDFSSWDYAVYLETTRSGQLINQLIPSSTEAMLHFKIDLLKCAFSKESMLLELPEADLMPVVRILHHVSLRTLLHPMILQHPEQNQEIAAQLFGTGPLFSTPETMTGLLTNLSDTGTLFIQNIEFLSLDTQERLLSYLTSGMFRQLRSDRMFTSNVRIICSTSNKLALLVQQGLFSAELFKKLKKVNLNMPSLLTISPAELTDLAQRLGEQAIKSQELNSILLLNERETLKIINERPASIHEFKDKIHRKLKNKSLKQGVDHLVTFESDYFSEEPEIIDAVKLGKDALKDAYMMNMLWNKFNSQTKIATLLKVNRSSVNRRLKKLNIGQDTEKK